MVNILSYRKDNANSTVCIFKAIMQQSSKALQVKIFILHIFIYKGDGLKIIIF